MAGGAVVDTSLAVEEVDINEDDDGTGKEDRDAVDEGELGVYDPETVASGKPSSRSGLEFNDEIVSCHLYHVQLRTCRFRRNLHDARTQQYILAYRRCFLRIAAFE